MDLNAGSQRIQSLGISSSAVGLPLPPDLFGIHAGSHRSARRAKRNLDGLGAPGALPAVSSRWVGAPPLPPGLVGIHAGSHRSAGRAKGNLDWLGAPGALPGVSSRWFRPRAVTAS